MMKQMTIKTKDIEPDKFYTPKALVVLGLMTASNKDTKRQMLLRFIRENRIDSLNVGTEKQPRYVVQGKHLIKYMDAQMKKGEYLKK